MPWWLWGLTIAIGLAVAGFVVYRAIGTGAIWDGLARSLGRGVRALAGMVINSLLPELLKRMQPEDEKRWRDSVARGEEWDFARNRPREKK